MQYIFPRDIAQELQISVNIFYTYTILNIDPFQFKYARLHKVFKTVWRDTVGIPRAAGLL